MHNGMICLLRVVFYLKGRLLIRSGNGQNDRKVRPLPRKAAGPYLAPMPVDDLVANRKTKTCAPPWLLGRKEWFKDAWELVFGDALPAVLHRDHDRISHLS